ncbi:MAG: phosphoglycolate phosphatase [Gammaproteobacteria bacterium]|nr:MAG: phosphoglycolate phosphatase [Gammaproteobacteria bacterium]
MSKQLLIFDLDGTLIDSVPDIAEATNAMLTELGLQTFGVNDVRHWVGNGSRKLIERALRCAKDAEPTTAQVDEAQALFFEQYAKQTALYTTAYKGVSEGLKQLKDHGYTMALATNKPYRYVPTILDFFGWTDFFAISLGGDSFSEKKPNPVALNHVCEQLNIPVENSYMIGDSLNDIYAGQNAGMDTIGLSYGYNYGQDIRDFNPTHVFDTFGEMVEFLLK